MALKSGPKLATRRRRAAWRDDPDVGLMERVRAGDVEAFAELRGRYAPRVFGFFCRQLRDRVFPGRPDAISLLDEEAPRAV